MSLNTSVLYNYQLTDAFLIFLQVKKGDRERPTQDTRVVGIESTAIHI